MMEGNWPSTDWGYFRGNLDGRWLHEKQEWELLSGIVYVDPSGNTHRIPEGFVCDFKSVPIMFRSLAFNKPRGRPAGALHDYHYRVIRQNRPWADTLFYYAMRAVEINPISASIYYQSVRRFGWYSWWKNG